MNSPKNLAEQEQNDIAAALKALAEAQTCAQRSGYTQVLIDNDKLVSINGDGTSVIRSVKARRKVEKRVKRSGS